MADVKKVANRLGGAGADPQLPSVVHRVDIRLLETAARKAGVKRAAVVRRGAMAEAECILAEGTPYNEKEKNSE